MTKFLVSEENLDGFKLEDILRLIRKDILARCSKITDDDRPEAGHVLSNNITILGLMTDAIELAEDSSTILQKSFGPTKQDGPPRIGTE